MMKMKKIFKMKIYSNYKIKAIIALIQMNKLKMMKEKISRMKNKRIIRILMRKYHKIITITKWKLKRKNVITKNNLMKQLTNVNS